MSQVMKRPILILLCAILAVMPALADEKDNISEQDGAAEEQGVEEIRQLLEAGDVKEKDGMSLEELSDSFSEQAMSDYVDTLTGFSMEYPSIFVFEEDQESPVAYTQDRSASLRIENMLGGKLTEATLLEAIRLEAPEAEPEKYEQVNCYRVDRMVKGSSRMRTDLYMLGGDSFHHVTMEYPAEEKDRYLPYIPYMVNTMTTRASEEG